MATILFDMFPAHGHYNGSFPLAVLLKKAGHCVYYLCDNEFQSRVQSININSYIIDPFIIAPISNEFKEKGSLNFFIESLSDVSQKKRFSKVEQNMKSYDEMINYLSPDLILVDELHFAYKSIFYGKYNTPTATLQTAISSDYDPEVPPFTSTYVVFDSRFNNLVISYLWNKYFLLKKIRSFFRSIQYARRSSRKIHVHFSKKYNFPFSDQLIMRRLLGFRFKNVPSLVCPPEAFDFPRSRKVNLHFIGPIRSQSENKQSLEGRLKSIVDEITKEKLCNPEIKLIYCSLGTVTIKYLKVCTRFFNHIASVCSNNSNFRVILSVGKFFDISTISTIPGNLFVFDHVLQSTLLQHCDIVINHGGINTIVECVMTEKPMVVFPLSLEWDQPGCAARVVHHQLGVKGIIRSATSISIEKLVTKVIDQEDYYVRNVQKMKAMFVDKSAYTLDLIERIIKEGNHVGQKRNKQAVC